jgi:hypothetical protein
VTITRRLEPTELWRVFDIFWAECKTNWKDLKGKPYPVDPNYLAKSWAALIDQGMGVAYATFSSDQAGKGALSLLEEFEKECKARGCTRIVFGLHPEYLGGRDAALRRLYRRKGFSPSTESYVKEL